MVCTDQILQSCLRDLVQCSNLVKCKDALIRINQHFHYRFHDRFYSLKNLYEYHQLMKQSQVKMKVNELLIIHPLDIHSSDHIPYKYAFFIRSWSYLHNDVCVYVTCTVSLAKSSSSFNIQYYFFIIYNAHTIAYMLTQNHFKNHHKQLIILFPLTYLPLLK